MSLNAYAAWLAKAETKSVRRRRSLPCRVSPSDTPLAIVDGSVSAASIQQAVVDDDDDDESFFEEGPYHHWLQRKESKLPLVKIIRDENEPNYADAPAAFLPPTNAELMQFPTHKLQRLLDRLNSSAPMKPPGIRTPSAVVDRSNIRSKKRILDTSTSPTSTRPGTKRFRRTSSSPKPRKIDHHRSPIHPGRTHTISHRVPIGVVSPRRLHATPMLDEARYWRDVDRFAFLS